MAKLLLTVAEMQNKQNWLNIRKIGIGGSEAAAALGLNPWKSQFQLWLEKTGAVEAEDLTNNEFVYWGKVLEQAVADRFCELTGKKVQRRGFLQSEEYPFMVVSVDRMVVGENAGLECKTANTYSKSKWEEDEIPDSYYVQCQHYMAVTGCVKWYIAVLIGGNKFVWKEIPRNDEDIAALIEAEKEFWKLVQTGQMPEVDGSAQCKEALQSLFQGGEKEPVILGKGEAIELIASLDEIKKSISDLETIKKEKENRLCKMLGNHEYGLVGERKVSWKLQAGKVTVDVKRLKTDHPDIYKKYSKIGKPFRVLRLG